MIFSRPISNTPQALVPWATRFTDEINRFHQPPSLWPVFADDEAAAAGNLKVGRPYVTPDGFLKRRMA